MRKIPINLSPMEVANSFRIFVKVAIEFHFVSEFRLYDNESWQGKIASTHRDEAVGL